MICFRCKVTASKSMRDGATLGTGGKWYWLCQKELLDFEPESSGSTSLDTKEKLDADIVKWTPGIAVVKPTPIDLEVIR